MQITNEDVELYRQFQKSPIVFIQKMWGLTPTDRSDKFVKGQNLTWQQTLILQAVERAINGVDKRKISIVSGHGIGKDAILSMLILWYLFCFKDAQVPCTAPTADLMHDVLWKEINIWLTRMPVKVQKFYEWSNGYIRIKERPETWFARARTARKDAPEAIAGVHGDFVFIAVDEASGVPQEVFQTAEGSLTGENVLVILISNGTRNEGYFYDTHHKDKANWQNLAFSSEDSPIVEDDFIQRIKDKYGLESDEYKIRVQGKFPGTAQMDDGGWVSLVQEEQITRITDGLPFLSKVFLGVDPSGGGDDRTIFCARDNFQARIIHKEDKSTSKSIGSKIIEAHNTFHIKAGDITVDNFGEGANVSREVALGTNGDLSVNSVNWGEKADDQETYINKRAECYFRARKWLVSGGAVTDDELRSELAQIKYKRNIRGRIQIMDKKDMIQLMGKSPDKADAFALTFYESDPQQVAITPNTSTQSTTHDIHAPI